MKNLWLAAGLALICAGPVLGADAPTKEPAKSDVQSKIEMHEKMAQVHKQAADCLRSGKPEKDCNAQAMKDCPMAHSGDCPFMGKMKGGHAKEHMQHMKGMMENDPVKSQ
jgi:hypothetical protein